MLEDDAPPPYFLNPNVTVTQAVPLHGQAMLAFVASLNVDLPPATMLANAPGVLLAAIVTPGENTPEGLIIEATAEPWFRIVDWLLRDPNAVFQFDWRQWEEIIAGAYTEAYPGAEVILTPRSGDKGVDVIITATLPGLGSVRFFDQVKRYSPGHVVTLEEVAALVGVLTLRGNVSKGIITTTSSFAPGVMSDESLKKLMPNRLELKPRDVLLPWLAGIAAKRNGK
jgi:restriction system protein